MLKFFKKVETNEPFPSDLLILSTSDTKSGKFYIETKSLDGETNLKEKSTIPALQEHFQEDIIGETAKNGEFFLTYESPNVFLYTFKGILDQAGLKTPVENRNIALRGCILKNTEFVIGVVIYSGHDTKIMKNSIKSKHKSSKLEKLLNYYIIGIFVVLIICCLIGSGLDINWMITNSESIRYLEMNQDSMLVDFFLKFASWILTFGNFIPISLIVTVEIVKFIQAIILSKDQKMYSKISGSGCIVNSSNLNEQLGQVNFIFSDKTGTLTCNKMLFKNAIIGNKIYGAFVEQKSKLNRATTDTFFDNLMMMEQQDVSHDEDIDTHRTDSQAKRLQNVEMVDEENEQTNFRKSVLKLKTKVVPKMSHFDKNQGFIETGTRKQSTDESSQKYVDFVDFYDISFEKLLTMRNPSVIDFIRCLSICHNITIFKNSYNASSPDELALVIFAKMMNFEFKGIDAENNITINEFGEEKTYKLLHNFDFTSSRKRMSVIIRDEDKNLIMYSKGADNIILQRSTMKIKDTSVELFQKNLSKLSISGLRTLALAKKSIEEKDLLDFEKKCQIALNSVKNSEESIEEHCSNFEQNLEIIGATALEDKLQEKVPETISFLREAGIKIWILTGDKIETAKNIGFSCGLLTQDMELIEVVDTEPSLIKKSIHKAQAKVYLVSHPELINSTNELSECRNKNGCGVCESCVLNVNFKGILDSIELGKEKTLYSKTNHKRKFGLLISGDSLIEICKQPNLEKCLIDLAVKCEVALCCRVSPKQKQEIVRLVKVNLPEITSLAIGDGANDVNMIIEADVGIGIKGVEGQQASNTADFSIGEFQMLKRLMVFYGREAYRKNSILVLFNFWKNGLLVLPQLWYALFYSNFSGNSLYDNYLYQLVNIVFTSVPILNFAIYDIELEEEKFEMDPEYYQQGLRESYFNKGAFLLWYFTAFGQSMLLCIISSICDFEPQNDGSFFGYWGFGMFMFTMIMLIVNIKVLILTNSFNVLTIPIAFLSFSTYLISFYITNKIPSSTSFGLFSLIFSSPMFYLLSFIVLLSCSFVDYLWNFTQKIIFFNNLNITYQFDRLDKDDRKDFEGLLKEYQTIKDKAKKRSKTVNFQLPDEKEEVIDENQVKEVVRRESIKNLIQGFESEILQKKKSRSFGSLVL